MATRAERFRADEANTQARKTRAAGANRKTSRSKPGAPPDKRSHDKPHAAKKATYALEVGADASKRPSRKSTRKSANRSKTGASFDRREALVKGSPETVARKAIAKRGAKAVLAAQQAEAERRGGAEQPAGAPSALDLLLPPPPATLRGTRRLDEEGLG
ncbi:MAG TPA: hypothetical protein VL400_22625 [Polyangiaceae bacterium]|jgi:hypothetical protein|nr:hypothetical protein [Polyangiaceae bacterium]